jgi:dTDP-4-amino-4,6-dideoxygalactose transaminase
MKVPLLDLKAQFQSIKDEIMAVVEEVSDSQQFILGTRVVAFEEKVTDYCQCKYAVGVSSGSDALLISLMAIGVGHGDLVITSPYTFFASAGCIARVGATPLFVDIDEHTYNMDPEKLETTLSSLSHQQRARLKAIMPIHLFGQCADMEAILKIARDANVVVIEDAAQAIGAEYAFSNGSVQRAGSMGEYGCFSFFPSKNLGAFGDGGMVTTNREEICDHLKILRGHGASPKYYHSVIGGNFRLDALQAAILSVKLKYLDEWTKRRVENASIYRKLFKEEGLGEFLSPPLEKGKRHIYNQFVVKIEKKRDDLKQFLGERGVGTEIYYPVPLHMQECFKYLNCKPEDFPVSAEAASKTLALPIYPELTEGKIYYIVDIIKEFFKRP